MVCIEYALTIIMSFLLSSLDCLSSFDINLAPQTEYAKSYMAERFCTIPNQHSQFPHQSNCLSLDPTSSIVQFCVEFLRDCSRVVRNS